MAVTTRITIEAGMRCMPAGMVRYDRSDLMIPQEPCHPGKMGSFGSLIVKRSPGEAELVADSWAVIAHWRRAGSARYTGRQTMSVRPLG